VIFSCFHASTGIVALAPVSTTVLSLTPVTSNVFTSTVPVHSVTVSEVKEGWAQKTGMTAGPTASIVTSLPNARLSLRFQSSASKFEPTCSIFTSLTPNAPLLPSNIALSVS
jgi:hypothetical protein